MKGVLMDGSFFAVSVLLLVVLMVMIPIRVKSKSVMMTRSLTTSEAHRLDLELMARQVRLIETGAGVILLVVTAIFLAFAYVAPYAGWYTFEVRKPILLLVSMGVAIYTARGIRAFVMARRIEAEFDRMKEKGTS